MTPPKIASDVSKPPPLTAEESKRLVEEGCKMAAEVAERCRSMQLTAEDWRTIVR